MKNSTYSRRNPAVSTVKQVARDDPGGLLAEEHPPRRGRSARGWLEPVTAEQPADRAGRDADAKPQQLAVDALIAPAGILPGQPEDQLLNLLAYRRSSWSTTRVGPRAGHEVPVPAQQRLRPDEETGPAGSWQDAADGSEQGPVGGFELDSWSVAAEDRELVAQDQDLEILGSVATGELGEELDGAAQRQVGESWQHRVGLRSGDSSGVTVASRGDGTPQLKGPVRISAPYELPEHQISIWCSQR